MALSGNSSVMGVTTGLLASTGDAGSYEPLTDEGDAAGDLALDALDDAARPGAAVTEVRREYAKRFQERDEQDADDDQRNRTGDVTEGAAGDEQEVAYRGQALDLGADHLAVVLPEWALPDHLDLDSPLCQILLGLDGGGSEGLVQFEEVHPGHLQILLVHEFPGGGHAARRRWTDGRA